jgi:hypothetical protein
MPRFIVALAFGTLLVMNSLSPAAEPDGRLFEMRIYSAAEGKLDALHARFRDHTTKLFVKHGITNIGYWTPVNSEDRQIIYVLAYPSREAREQSWKNFAADPAWIEAKQASEVNGKLVDKVVTKFLQATDYSPAIKLDASGNRVFELRTYTTTPGNLDALHARFRDHTVKLFEKHGMTNVIYWTLTADQPAADKTLIYLLAHDSQEAAKASFAAFRSDPVWVAARTASEAKAGGSLTEAQDGVLSLFMTPTDYSPIR